MNIDDWKEKIRRDFPRYIYICMLALGLGSALSEPFSRNCVRLALLLTGVYVLERGEVFRRLSPYKWFLVALFFMVGVLGWSAWYGGNFLAVVLAPEFWHQYSVLIFAVVCLFIDSKKRLLRIVDMGMVSLLIMNFFIYYQAYSGVFRPLSPMHGSYMMTAMFYVIMLPIILLRALEERHNIPLRIFYFVTLLSSGAAFLLTNTRGAWLAAIPPMLCIMLFYRQSTRRRLFTVFALIMLIASMVLCVPNLSARLSSIGDLSNRSQSERLLMYESAVAMIKDHPLCGIGVGNYQREYLEHYVSPKATEFNHLHTHNTPLQFTIDAGVFGLSAYVFLFGYIICWSWRRRGNIFGIMLLASTSALILYGLTDYTIAGYSAMRLYYLLLGVCVKGAYES